MILSGTLFESFKKNLDVIVKGISNSFGKLFLIVLALVIAKVVLFIISYFTNKRINYHRDLKNNDKSKRINTAYTLFHSLARYLIYFLVAAYVLTLFGVSLEGILGVTGILSLAIGFGAQSLIKDVVTGAFLLFENQFSVGDYINVNGEEGFVEAMALRVTYLKTLAGVQVIIPNGTISKVVNISRGDALAQITIRTPYDINSESLIKELQSALKDFEKENDNILETPRVLGITKFEVDHVEISIVAKVEPLKHIAVERDLRLFIKKYFDENKIKMPYLPR